MSDWFRVRFKSRDSDPRPDVWPPNGPFWCTGYDAEDRAIIVAYVLDAGEPELFWYKARELEVLESSTTIKFTDRFSEPDWWRDLR